MTQYLLSVYETAEGPQLTKEERDQSYRDTGVFNDEIMASGHWVFAGGLHAPDTATVVDNTQGEAIVTDGPFAETKELLGGFWIIEAANLDEALELAKRGSKACRNPVEVRPFHDEPPTID